MNSGLKNITINFGILLSAVLICFVSLEIYLRHLHADQHTQLVIKYTTHELCTTQSDHPALIYTYIPNKCNANSHGYFDNEYSYDKDSGVYRIVVIGDSVAQGQGVSVIDSFGKALEAKLTKQFNQHIEVILLARSGYSTSQQLYILKNEAFRYDPDLIIWSYVLNDPAHPVFHDANGELGRYFYKPGLHTFHLIKYLYFELNERIKGRNCVDEYHARLHCIYANQVSENIKTIGMESALNNVPVLFMIHPVFEKNNNFKNYSLTPIHDRLSGLAVEAGLDTIDLLEAHKQHLPSSLHITGYADGWWDPWHPNIKGHKLIADQLVQYMEKRQLIKIQVE